MVSLLSPDARTCVRFEDEGALLFTDSAVRGRRPDDGPQRGIDNRSSNGPSHSLRTVRAWRSSANTGRFKFVEFPGGEYCRSQFPVPDSAKYTVDKKEYRGKCRVNFSADGKTLLLGTYGGTVHRWDLATRKRTAPTQGPCRHCGPGFTSSRIREDGNNDRGGWPDSGADGQSSRSGAFKDRRRLRRPTCMRLTRPTADSQQSAMAAGSWNCGTRKTGKRVRALQDGGPAVKKLTFAPDGKARWP